MNGLNWILIGSMTFLLGCAATPPARNAVPLELVDDAAIPGFERVRYQADTPPPWSLQWLEAPDEELRANFGGIMDREHHYLAISGGGANGAYGAGILVGWTEAGTRPEFTMVTGISTGAITAPLAFLGPDYDDDLREVYTAYDTEDLVGNRGVFAIFRQDAVRDSAPLRATIANYVDDELVARLAEEYAKGRQLIVGTTNLDTMRHISWNLTRIAASGVANRAALIEDIILASASIPVALQPVMIEVEANGETYEEMHVDGGATSQVYFYPPGMDWDRVLDRLNVPGRPALYVIRNAKIIPDYQVVERRTMAIAAQSIASLLRTQGIGDLFRIYLTAQRDGLEYRGATIPNDFSMEATETFDPVYMQALFELGYESARNGYPWSDQPPGLELD